MIAAHLLLQEVGRIAAVSNDTRHPSDVFDLDLSITQDILRPRLDTDKRIARDPLATFHGLQ